MPSTAGLRLDGGIELVCGAFSSSVERSQRSGATLLVVPGAFHGFQFMAPEAESSRHFNAAVNAAIARAVTEFAPAGSNNKVRLETGA